jgi:hypothetical protein
MSIDRFGFFFVGVGTERWMDGWMKETTATCIKVVPIYMRRPKVQGSKLCVRVFQKQ